MPIISTLVAGTVAAVTAIATFTIGGIAVGQMALGLALNLGLSAIQGVFAKKKSQPSGADLDLQTGGDVAKWVCLGRTATAGHLVYFKEHGNGNKFLSLVYVVSSGRCGNLLSVWVDDDNKALISEVIQGNEDARYSVEDYSDYIDIRYYNGGAGQPADASLVAISDGDFTENDVGAGLAYVVVRLEYKSASLDSVPSFLWETEGYCMYDPRLDSSIGGSGAHRWDEPATWEPSNNNAVQVYNVLRGLQANGKTIIGGVCRPYDLITDTFAAAANICDEQVTVSADIRSSYPEMYSGTTENRYRNSMIVKGKGTDTRDNIAPAINAMAGSIIERNGAIGVLAGSAIVPSLVLTDSDLDPSTTTRMSYRLPRDQRFNEVQGSMLSVSSGWQQDSYPTISDSAALAEDGEPLVSLQDWPTIISPTQAQRCSRIRLLETRYGARATVSFGWNSLGVEAGDWILWDSAKYGSRMWLVQNVSRAENDVATFTLAERANEIYQHQPSDNSVYSPPEYSPGSGYAALGLSNFVVTPSTISTADGAEIPTMVVTYDVPEAPTVDAVVLEYRVVGSLQGVRVRDDVLDDGSTTIVGVEASVDYEVRGTLTTTPARPVAFTNWVTIKTLSRNQSLRLNEFRDDVRGVMESTVNRLKQLEDQMNSLATDNAAQSMITESQTLDVVANVSNAKASVTQEAKARANANEALSSLITSVQSSIGDVEASITQEADTRALADAALSTSVSSVQSSIGGVEASITQEANARTSADVALSTLISSVQASVDGLDAQGLFKVQAAAAPSGVVVRLALMVRGSKTATNGSQVFKESGIYLDLLNQASGFASQISMQSDKIILTDGSKNSSPFAFIGNELVYNGVIRSVDGKFRIDGGAAQILIADDS